MPKTRAYLKKEKITSESKNIKNNNEAFHINGLASLPVAAKCPRPES